MTTSGVLAETVDPSSDRAVYKQIADHLRAAIARERLGPGDQLPSEAQLMAHYGVARMTARNALRLLQDEGLITAEHGRGVYVRARPPVRRLASDRFAQRHRKEGKAAFTVEAEQAGAHPDVDMIKVTTGKPPGRGRLAAAAARRRQDGDPVPPVPTGRPPGRDRGLLRPGRPGRRHANQRAEPRTRRDLCPARGSRSRAGAGSPRKCRRGCRPPTRPAPWRCRRACPCSGWSAPPTTPRPAS